MANKTKQKMKTSSKLIISVLVVFCLLVSGGWAYSEGYLKLDWFNDDLEAVKSNYPFYIERFDWNGMEFVQNVAVATPTPESVKDAQQLDGVLTLRARNKTTFFYIDTPARISLDADDKLFFLSHSSETYTDENNKTFTRYKFYALPDVEKEIRYKILNVNEFIDHNGEVVFKLLSQDLKYVYEVKTKFVSPLSEYEGEISLEDYYTNRSVLSLSHNSQLTGQISPTKTSTNKGIISSKGFRVVELGDKFRVSFLPTSYKEGTVWYHDFTNSKPLNYQISSSGKLVFNNLEFWTNSLSTIYFSGRETNVKTDLGKPKPDNNYYLAYDGYSNFCMANGFDSTTDRDYESTNLGSYSFREQIIKLKRKVWIITNIRCGASSFMPTNNIEGIVRRMSDPYFIDSTKTISIPQNLSEVKFEVEGTWKTVEVSKNDAETVSTFIIPSSIELKEFEVQDIKVKVGDKIKIIPVFYDPDRKQKTLFEQFERKLAEITGGE